MAVQFFVNGIVAGSFYILIAVGFGLIYSTARFFHFAHGAVYTVGAYGLYTAYVLGGLPLPIAVVAAVGIAGALGGLMEWGCYRPLRKKGATPLILLLASLGLYILFQNGLSLLFGDDVKSVRGGIVVEGLEVWGARITPIQITIIIVAVLLLGSCWWFLTRSALGKELRAVANDPALAKAIGIDVDRVYLVTFLVGSVLVGIAAVLISFDTDITPMMGFYALLMGVVAVIVGGIGSLPGAALGGLLLGMAQHLGLWKIGSQWQDTIAFVILLIFLTFRPYGFFGVKLKKAEV